MTTQRINSYYCQWYNDFKIKQIWEQSIRPKRHKYVTKTDPESAMLHLFFLVTPLPASCVIFFQTGQSAEAAGRARSNGPIRRLCGRNLKVCAAPIDQHKLYGTTR